MSNKSINKEIEEAEREILMAKFQTSLKKNQLINDLKTGLGEEVKTKAGKVKIIEKSWFEKLKIKLKKLFTTF